MANTPIFSTAIWPPYTSGTRYDPTMIPLYPSCPLPAPSPAEFEPRDLVRIALGERFIMGRHPNRPEVNRTYHDWVQNLTHLVRRRLISPYMAKGFFELNMYNRSEDEPSTSTSGQQPVCCGKPFIV